MSKQQVEVPTEDNDMNRYGFSGIFLVSPLKTSLTVLKHTFFVNFLDAADKFVYKRRLAGVALGMNPKYIKTYKPENDKFNEV